MSINDRNWYVIKYKINEDKILETMTRLNNILIKHRWTTDEAVNKAMKHIKKDFDIKEEGEKSEV